LVVHQALAGGNMSEAQRAFLGDLSLVVDTRALGAIGFDAILAGHFHLHQYVLGGGPGIGEGPVAVYAGSPYRTDFGEEDQEKGYLIVDLDGLLGIEFVPTPARRFVTIDGDPYEAPMHQVDGAIVRCLNVPDDVDVAQLRRDLEAEGAFEVQEIRIRRGEAAAIAGGLAETLAPTEALEAYFADALDVEQLVGRGREILAAVS
jgi:exonuclease SbcD